MADGYLLNLRTFREVKDDKAQALKPLEEAAEAFGAWQLHDGVRHSQIMTARRAYRVDLIDECLDTVQATVNLLAAVGATQGEVDAGIRRMDERNGGKMKAKKKAMISQPMAGRTDAEIVEEREKAVAELEGMGYEVVNTLFTDEWYSDEAMEERGVVQVPLCHELDRV